MKALLCACALSSLLCLPAAGQRGGRGGGGSGRPGVSVGNFGLPQVNPIPPLGLTTPPVTFGERGFRRFERGSGAGYNNWYPAFYSDSAYQGSESAYQASPSMVVVMPEAVQPATPPRPVQAEVHDYTKINPPETAQGPPAEFAIVGKDHATRHAVAVWAQSGVLHYVDPDGASNQMPLSAVDREATWQANAAKGLRLQIPAE